MVPVPEDLADEVKRYLMQIDMRAAAKERTSLDVETVCRDLPAFNDRCRLALSALARATLTGTHLTVGELAEQLGWASHDTVGVVQELNELVWAAFGPFIALVKKSPTDKHAGAVDWNEREVVVWQELAEAVVSAEASSATRA